VTVAAGSVFVLESPGVLANEDITLTRPLRVYDVIYNITAFGLGAGSTIVLQRQALGTGVFNSVAVPQSTLAIFPTLWRTTQIIPAEQDCQPSDVLRFAAVGGNLTQRALCFAKVIAR